MSLQTSDSRNNKIFFKVIDEHHFIYVLCVNSCDKTADY